MNQKPQTPTARARPLPFVLPRLLLILLAKILILGPAKEFRVDVSKPREPHLSECPTLVLSTEYKRKRRNDKNTRAMQRTTPCTSPGLSSAATARRCNKREQKEKRKITGKT